MILKSFPHSLVFAFLALTTVSAGASGTAVQGHPAQACRQSALPADRPDREHGPEMPFLGASGPAEAVAVREAGPMGTVGAESRQRVGTGDSGPGRRASTRSPQSVLAAESRRLLLAPGLARVAGGRLTLFANAPPFPTV